MSKTGSDSEPGEEVCGGHDPQRQDRRRADRGELQGGCIEVEMWIDPSVVKTFQGFYSKS